MLVHVKKPRTEVRISGIGARRVLEVLQAAFPDAVVEDEDEAIPVEQTEWYRKMQASSTSGKALRVYRRNAGLSQDRLAKASGVAKSHISAMENDTRPLGRITAKKLADVLGCDYRSLL